MMVSNKDVAATFDDAVVAHTERRYSDAERQYLKVITAEPGHHKALFNLAQLAVQFKKKQIAIHYFKAALSKNTQSELYWQTFLTWLIKIHDLTEAIMNLKVAKNKNIKNEILIKIISYIDTDKLNKCNDTKHILSELYLLGFYENVLTLVLGLKTESVPEAFIYSITGGCELKLENYENAVKNFSMACKSEPESDRNWYNLGCSYAKLKKWTDAENAYLRSLNISKTALAYNNLGLALQAMSKTSDAIQSYKRGLALEPENAEIFNNLGTSLKIALRYDEAERCFIQAIKYTENFAQAHNNLGTLLELMGRFEEAESQYQTSLRISPNFIQAILNLGNCANRNKNYDQAIVNFNQVLEIDPSNPEAHNNLGTVYKSKGKISLAKSYYERALALDPNLARVHSNLAILYNEAGDSDEAIRKILRALELSPNDALAWNNLGAIYKDADMLSEAKNALYKAIELSPELVPALYNLAGLLERSNEVEELNELMTQIQFRFDELQVDLKFIKSKLYFRKKEYEQSYEILKNINVTELEEQNRTGYFSLIGMCLERLGDYEKSFSEFAKMNELAKIKAKYHNFKPEEFINGAEQKLVSLQKYQIKKRKIIKQNDSVERVFLVGFPRSGTTLLDTVLRSHSKVTVIEEKPMVHLALQKLREPVKYDFLDSVPTVEDLDNCRRAYKEEEQKHISMMEDTKVIVNKLPLNILQIPFIISLFPNAKFILAMRHPYDSMLSCWMQDFQLNASMANMTDLSTISRLYNICFNSFDQCKEKLGIEWHQVRYESLISNFKSEVNSLLNFLNLDWEDRLLLFQETAKVRGKINTPSYSQVVQPIYQDAKFRWKKYEKYVQEPFSKSRKWLVEFDYE